jgi:hypothetical protein
VSDIDDSSFFTLQISADTFLEPGGPNDDIIKFLVTLIPYDETGGRLPESGRFGIWLFNIGAYVNRQVGPLFELFDADSQEAADLHEALFDPDTDDFRPGIVSDPPMESDLIYVQHADLPDRLKRSPVTLAAVERSIQVLGGGCGVAALWPWDNPHPDLAKMTAAGLLAYWDKQKENEEFWGLLTFTRLEGSPILIRDLAMKGPSIPEILSPAQDD